MPVLYSPPDCLPSFDTLFVVSDLHLGGAKRFQIFDAGDAFGRFVDSLCTDDPEQKIALLINGDLVDFLAESPSMAFDPEGAITKLENITKEPAFAPVWDSLSQFIATPNRWLLINMGNHDLELALPWVRHALLTRLAGQNDAAYRRIHVAFDGTGIRCRVGNAEIVAVHGNEVDDWNVTDYEHLRRIGRDLMMGREVAPWVPNAGSQMVIEVMNSLKHQFPFIDLLKPEGPAVLPTLLALAPNQYNKLMSIASVASRLGWDAFQRGAGWLGQANPALAWSPTDSLGSVTVANPVRLGMNHPNFKKNLLRETEERFNQGIDPMHLVRADQPDDFLGWWAAAAKLVGGYDRAEVLREALETLQKDQSFDYFTEDDTFRRLDARIGPGPTFVVAGHTHLARALPRQQGRGWYFNSGTWVRLIQLKPETLRDADAFKSTFNAFKAGDMATLDQTEGLVLRRLTVVKFWKEDTRTMGGLFEAEADVTKKNASTKSAKPILKPVPNTQFPT